LRLVRHGSDGNGKDGLVGFFDFLLRSDLRVYASLIAKLIPIKVDAGLTVGITAVNIVKRVRSPKRKRPRP
jgi:hypothetical protein